MNNNIKHGNCMEFTPPKCRLLLTDIPYGEVNRSDSGLRKLDKDNADIVTFDTIDFMNHIYDCADIFIIFCGYQQFAEILEYFKTKPGTVRPLMWCKSNPSPMNGEYVLLNAVETAVWFKKRGTGKLPVKCKKNWYVHPTGSSKIHPTEKNHKLLEELITDNTVLGDVIYDPCMGSGSTGLVANKLENTILSRKRG